MVEAAQPVPPAAVPVDRIVEHLVAAEEESHRRHVLEDAVRAGDAHALLTAIKAESLRQLTIDPHVALRLADDLLHGAALAGGTGYHALACMARGDALRYLGRYPEAVSLLEEAGQEYSALGDEVGWARTRLGWIVAMHRLGRGEEALEVVDRAREILERHGEWRLAGGLDLNTAVTCRQLGHYRQALSLYDRARASYAALGDAGVLRVGWTMMNKAIVLTQLGEFDAALALHQEARGVFQRLGVHGSLLRSDQNVGYLHAGMGRFTRALHHYREALALAEEANLDADAGALELNIVECYLSLNQDAEALALARAAAERFARLGSRADGARARLLSAIAHARRGDAAAAAQQLDEASELAASAGLWPEHAAAAHQRAALCLAGGESAAALEHARYARRLFLERGVRLRRAESEVTASHALLGLDRPDEAATYAHAALETAHDAGADWVAAGAYHALAKVHRTHGRVREALDECERAIAAVERARGRLAAQLSARFLADKIAVYHDAIACALRLEDPALALSYLERAKSRSLVDYLAVNPDVRLRAGNAADQALVDRLTRLRAEHSWFYNRLHGERPGDGADDEIGAPEADALRTAIQDRELQISTLLERLSLRAAAGEGIAALDPARRPMLPVVDRGTALVEYYLHTDQAIAFVVAGDRVRAVTLDATPAKLLQALAQWHLNLQATAQCAALGPVPAALTRNARGILRELHRMLVEPIAALIDGCRRLTFIPHGAAHSVPFHALYDGSTFLVERAEVSVCPSADLLRLCVERAGRRAPGPRAALVMAYSDSGRLPYALDEARAIASLLPGELYVEDQATSRVIAERAPHHAVLHLAAHGEARLDRPAFAHVKLADGQLDTAGILNLALEGALVVLSACETGRAVVVGGDELIGLSRGFLFAGAAALVQSLWRVQDQTAARQMERFYRALQEGHTKGEALRAAQLALIDGQEGHPYLWAPFQLLGEHGAL